MHGRAAAIIPTLAILAALSGCSKATIVQARFVEGRIAFIGIEQELGCVYDIEVAERATGKPVWKVEDDFSDRKCLGDDPHFYGESYTRSRTSVAPAKLRLDTDYEVRGTAAGSNYFSGAFRITRDNLYRIEDLPR